MMSIVGLAGLVVHTGVILACTAAAWAAGARRRGGHVRAWLVCACAFILFAVLGAFEIDDLIGRALKQFSKRIGAHEDRAFVQVPLVGLTIVGTIGFTLVAARSLHAKRAHSGDRLVALALFGTLGFVPLHALRIISWHDIDAILYSGSLHLNWLIELALCAVVAVSAALYIRASSLDAFPAAPPGAARDRLRRGPAPRGRR